MKVWKGHLTVYLEQNGGTEGISKVVKEALIQVNAELISFDRDRSSSRNLGDVALLLSDSEVAWREFLREVHAEEHVDLFRSLVEKHIPHAHTLWCLFKGDLTLTPPPTLLP